MWMGVYIVCVEGCDLVRWYRGDGEWSFIRIADYGFMELQLTNPDMRPRKEAMEDLATPILPLTLSLKTGLNFACRCGASAR